MSRRGIRLSPYEPWAAWENTRLNTPPRKIAILGAGAIGCFLGAHWASACHAAGTQLTLIGRPATWDQMAPGPLRVSGGVPLQTQLSLLDLADSPAALDGADLVLLAHKSTGLERSIQQLSTHVSDDTTIISLMNGVSPVDHLRAALPRHHIVAGMVPFNVVWKSGSHLHRSSTGNLALERTCATEALAQLVAATGVPVQLCPDLKPLQYGKLLLNLINPVNALSGLPLREMLCQRDYRRVYAAVLREALSVYDAAHIQWRRVGPLSPRLVHRLLLLPDAVFNSTLLNLQKLDPESMTSMAADMAAGRPTEIDTLTNEILRLAEQSGTAAPINASLSELIRQAEAAPHPTGAWSAQSLLEHLRLSHEC